LNWGCPSDALWVKLKDEDEYLYYTFITPWGEPIPIYELLIKRYSALDFDIHFIYEDTDNWVELLSRKGHILKKSYMYWECIPWRDEESKLMLHRKNLFDDSIQVIEERIFNIEEYDEVWLRQLQKT
jgi:hypothetical protein